MDRNPTRFNEPKSMGSKLVQVRRISFKEVIEIWFDGKEESKSMVLRQVLTTAFVLKKVNTHPKNRIKLSV